MAFEDFTQTLLARAGEPHDPGSAETYLRLTVASEATLKLAGICLLSEGAYRYGSEPAKRMIAETIAGRTQGWSAVLDVAARLPESCALAKRIVSEPTLADRVHEVWTLMDAALTKELGAVTLGVTKRKTITWRHALRFLPILRNKVKGHGAPPARMYAQLNPLLREMVECAVADLIAPIPPALAFMRPTRDRRGLFLGLGTPVKEVELPIEIETLQPGDMVLGSDGDPVPLVPLVTFDERTRALLIFNDSVAEATGELEYIDYIQGPLSRRGGHFVTRHGFAELGPSETTAAPMLTASPGLVENNLPERRRAHIPRVELESELERLLLDDKHRIISLDGRGGIGKTYLAMEVCRRVAAAGKNRFGFILWMSARDVDLTTSGPKPVRQDLVTLDDVLRFVLRAFDAKAPVENVALDKLQTQFEELCKAISPLLVLDNFETFAEPERLHRFLDDVLPFPAKALITSRHRYFQGDFPLSVGPMSEKESRTLILDEARRRGVMPQFESADRVRRVYEVAQGHAYTMRLIVTQVSDKVTVHDACRAVEASPDVLAALFERSLRLAQPIDAEVAAILAGLRAECPLEALLLLPLPQHEIEEAVGRLFHLSLLERIVEPLLHHPQYMCPRAAGEYIRRKGLLDSPEARATIEKRARGLNAQILLMRALAKKVPGGVRTRTQAADVMICIAHDALNYDNHPLVRRAVDVALDLADDDSAIVVQAAAYLRGAQSDPAAVDGMFERALGLDPSNASSWIEWGHFKVQTGAPHGQAMVCFERALEADPKNIEGALEFAGSVLEVVKQEKKLGAGAARVNDRRPARTLLAKARTVLDRHLLATESALARTRLLGLKGWIVLQLEGIDSATLMDVVAQAEELAPTDPQIRRLVQAVERMVAERRSGGRDGGRDA